VSASSRVVAVPDLLSKLLPWARLRTHLGAKIAVLLGLSVGICVPYFSLQRLDLFAPRMPPVTALDQWVAFDPGWLWTYLSVGVLVPLAPLLATSRDELARYARGLALLCLTCFAAFLVFPVEGPRPAIAPDHGAYQLLVAYDRSVNSFPSLHAGLAAYSLLFASRVLRGDLPRPPRVALGAAGAVWVALILYSTLATRQHWAVDLPAGVMLAVAAHALAWRSADRALRRSEAPIAAS
jgi:membrane-associated phospholipid phosphatase